MGIMDLFKLDGRVAIVTGGARGIGYAIAHALADAGAAVSIVDRDHAQAQEAASAIASATGNLVLALEADVSDEQQCADMVAQTITSLGCLDICFANAGIAEPDLPILDFEAYGSDLWDKVMAVNLRGVYLTDMAVAKAMRRSGGGTIINTGSILSMVADTHWGSLGYTASKGGVAQLTRQLAAMLAPHNIRVNLLAPGYVATGASEAEQLENGDPVVRNLQEAVLSRTLLKRYAEPEEIAGMALFLASKASSYCTGGVYAVDGGWLAA